MGDPEKPAVYDEEVSAIHDEEKGETKGLFSHRFCNATSLLIVFPPLATLTGDDPSSSLTMWTFSIAHADKHDRDMVERWKDDMDGILIYVSFY
jgi:hypothetical protein